MVYGNHHNHQAVVNGSVCACTRALTVSVGSPKHWKNSSYS